MGRLLTRLGLAGAGIAAFCCVTPVLPWLFGALGVSGALGFVYRDEVLLPILAVFLGLASIGVWLKRRRAGPAP